MFDMMMCMITLSPGPAEVLDAARELPLAERLALWRALGDDIFATASAWGAAGADDAGDSSDDAFAHLSAQRRACADAAQVASRIARTADAVMHSFADAHHEAVRRMDHLEFEMRLVDEKHFCAGEFAAAELGATLGLRTSAAEALVDAAHGLRRLHPRLWASCGAGESRVAAAASVMEEIAHLAPEERMRVESIALEGRFCIGSVAAARRRTRELLTTLRMPPRALPEAAAEQEVGLWFQEHLDHAALTDLHVTLDAEHAWLLQEAIDAHARALVEDRETACRAALDDVAAARNGSTTPLTDGAASQAGAACASSPQRSQASGCAGDVSSASVPEVTQTGVGSASTSPSVGGYSLRRARVDALVDLVLGGVHLKPEITLRVPATLRPEGAASADTTTRLLSSTTPGTDRTTHTTTAPVTRTAPMTEASASQTGRSTTPRATTSRAESGMAMPSTPFISPMPSFDDVHVPRIGTVSGVFVGQLTRIVGASFRVALTADASGTTAWTSTSAYRPTAAQRRFVAARDVHCRFPNCMRPAAHCDVDHVVAHADGGATEPANLQLLCRRHHRVKTHGAWAVAMTPDGVCVWQSPLGQWFRSAPGVSTAEPLTPEQGLDLVA